MPQREGGSEKRKWGNHGEKQTFLPQRTQLNRTTEFPCVQRTRKVKFLHYPNLCTTGGAQHRRKRLLPPGCEALLLEHKSKAFQYSGLPKVSHYHCCGQRAPRGHTQGQEAKPGEDHVQDSGRPACPFVPFNQRQPGRGCLPSRGQDQALREPAD